MAHPNPDGARFKLAHISTVHASGVRIRSEIWIAERPNEAPLLEEEAPQAQTTSPAPENGAVDIQQQPEPEQPQTAEAPAKTPEIQPVPVATEGAAQEPTRPRAPTPPRSPSPPPKSRRIF